MLDQGYSYDLEDEEARELGRRSIYAAGHRDAFSGNTVNLFHVKENGWEFVSCLGLSFACARSPLTCSPQIENVDINELHYVSFIADLHFAITDSVPLQQDRKYGYGPRIEQEAADKARAEAAAPGVQPVAAA